MKGLKNMGKERRRDKERRHEGRRVITRRNEDRREMRRKQTSEFFTPNKLANEMLDIYIEELREESYARRRKQRTHYHYQRNIHKKKGSKSRGS